MKKTIFREQVVEDSDILIVESFFEKARNHSLVLFDGHLPLLGIHHKQDKQA
jgi:hypothetical protein